MDEQGHITSNNINGGRKDENFIAVSFQDDILQDLSCLRKTADCQMLESIVLAAGGWRQGTADIILNGLGQICIRMFGYFFLFFSLSTGFPIVRGNWVLRIGEVEEVEPDPNETLFFFLVFT